MIGRPAVIARFPGGSQIPPQDAIVAPGASYAVARHPIACDQGAPRESGYGHAGAMETTERFPQRLGNLAHDARFPHSHSRSISLSHKKKRKRKTYDMRYARQLLDRRPPVKAR